MDLSGVWYIFGAAALAVAVFVYGLMAYSILKWRIRKNDGGGLPEQFHGNPPIEITGVVIPLIIVTGLFYITYIREGVVDFLKPHPYAVVDVTGFQWSWKFYYPARSITVNGGVGSPPVLVLPEGRMTQINLYSSDVIHAFWVPEFLFKRDATPGYTMHFDVTPDRVGIFTGKCAEYCGLDHADMTFAVDVVPSAVYQRWLASKGSFLEPAGRVAP
jgi:cytochrome c oxidase subunit 2